MKKPFLTLLRIFLILLTVQTSLSAGEDDVFAVPEILKNNVTFWKSVYTNLSLKQGLLHDRDYPLVIFDTVDLVDDGRSVSRQVVAERARVDGALEALVTKPDTEWTDYEKHIKSLYDTYATPGVLAGARERVRLQQGQKERFLKGLERSGMYLDTIRAIFNQYGIPERIVFLPHVESSFDYKAYSKVGAAGLWQFMRSTGKSYLKINYLVDERLDPILETYAAAKLLSFNFNEIQSWPLAITAYNHGLNGMKRAVESTGSRDIAVIIERHQSPSFQFASKNFYSCFLAASEIAADAAPYFGQVNYLPRVQYREITLDYYIRPDVICTYLGVAEPVIRELNPALRPVVFQQQKPIPEGYVLRIPASLPVDVALNTVEAKIPDSLKQDRPEELQYYRVKRGDNLSVIADQLGVSAQQLAMENDISAKKRIYAGQVLRIPAKGAAKLVALAAASTPEPLPPPHALEEKSETAATVVPRFKPAAPSTAVQEKTPVPAVDSLRQILTATADTIPDIARPVKPTAQSRSQMARFDVGMYDLETVMSPDGASAEIMVTVDETVGHYADWLGVLSADIRHLNRIGGKGSIRIGRKLQIPVGKARTLAEFARARLEYHMALEEDFYGRYKVADVRAHVIKRGETLWDICGEDEIPLWLFKKHNKHLDLGTLMPGNTVWIPVIEEKTEEDVARESMDDGGIHPVHHEPVRRWYGGVRLMP